ncbi:MAG: hypothetical protein ABFS42_10030 [Candidatus Krumholzibacteriota bacterium]
MRNLILPITIVIILTTGCVHEAPLTKEHTLAIDPALLGLWELVPGEAKGDPDEDRMVVMRWSDTEYLVQLPLGAEGDFFRAYPAEIGGRSLVQAEFLGNCTRDWYPPEKTFFPVVTYEIVEGILIVSSLNHEVVDVEITDSAALREAFLKNKDRQDLFSPPAHYRRIDNK